MNESVQQVLVGERRWAVEQGDCLAWLRTLPDACVQCCMTSPPYYALRDYGTGRWEGGAPDCDHQQEAPRYNGPKQTQAQVSGHASGAERHGRTHCHRCGATRVDDQIGLESSPGAYVARLVEVFCEVRRVLRPDATLWLNLGDSYITKPMGNGSTNDPKYPGGRNRRGNQPDGNRTNNPAALGLKHKDLVGIPWAVAFALRDDGWYLRSDIIWHKPSPMPESVTDRPTKSHEYLFLLTKNARYYYDADAIREPYTYGDVSGDGPEYEPPGGGPKHKGLRRRSGETKLPPLEGSHGTTGHDGNGMRMPEKWNNPAGRNKRSVWIIASTPFPGAHFATFPPALVEPCVLAGTSAKGCCPTCGAPWRRLTEKTQVKRSRPKDYVKRTGEEGTGNSCANTVAGVSVQTLGWEPSCKCPAQEPIGCLVLDPFAGAATTGLVSLRLGRRFIGAELNPEYVEMGRKRLVDDAPLFN